MSVRTVLVTGGLGYVGSHVVDALLKHQFRVVIVDDLSNSDLSTLKRLRSNNSDVTFYRNNMTSQTKIEEILVDESVEAVFHFAGKKSVPESFEKPSLYYEVNVGSTATLAEAMVITKVKTLIFSSSASVYGQPLYLPIDEEHPVNPESPYAKTKLTAEQLLYRFTSRHSDLTTMVLRYFNPSGGAPEIGLGDLQAGSYKSITKVICDCAISGETLPLYGDDYDTKDGTCVRDFIDVRDLAEAHVKAYFFAEERKPGFQIVNLGSGSGVSIRELIEAFNSGGSVFVKHRIEGRRRGDIAASYASIRKAQNLLNWKPKIPLSTTLRDAFLTVLSHKKLD